MSSFDSWCLLDYSKTVLFCITRMFIPVLSNANKWILYSASWIYVPPFSLKDKPQIPFKSEAPCAISWKGSPVPYRNALSATRSTHYLDHHPLSALCNGLNWHNVFVSLFKHDNLVASPGAAYPVCCFKQPLFATYSCLELNNFNSAHLSFIQIGDRDPAWQTIKRNTNKGNEHWGFGRK